VNIRLTSSTDVPATMLLIARHLEVLSSQEKHASNGGLMLADVFEEVPAGRLVGESPSSGDELALDVWTDVLQCTFSRPGGALSRPWPGFLTPWTMVVDGRSNDADPPLLETLPGSLAGVKVEATGDSFVVSAELRVVAVYSASERNGS